MKRKVLIVDDNNQDRYLLRSLVEGENCEAVLAIDGLYGSQKFLEFKDELACVFLDFQMPDMSGIEFLKSFGGVELGYQAPIHLVTGVESVVLTPWLQRLGVQTIIKKPVTQEENVRKIQKIITESRGLTWR